MDETRRPGTSICYRILGILDTDTLACFGGVHQLKIVTYTLRLPFDMVYTPGRWSLAAESCYAKEYSHKCI